MLLLISNSYHVFIFLLCIRHLLNLHSILHHRDYPYFIDKKKKQTKLRLRENKKLTQGQKE